MTDWLPPAAIFIVGALLIPLFKGRFRQVLLLAVPALAFLNLLNMHTGSHYSIDFLGHALVFGKVDRLSMVFGYIFVIMAFAGSLFALHLKKAGQHVAAFLYVACSLGVVFAGDYISLFCFWEGMALASVYLIWAERKEASLAAGFRYVLVHFTGGLVLLAGIVLHIYNTGSVEFGYLGLSDLASWLIIIGFALNAAIPPLSAWLSDAYPEATVTGAVFLSAFTSKTAVYVLARAFPGAEILIWAGVIMSVYGIVYAMLENDIRRILAYSIINQVGFMLAGVGIGTELAINGAASHAFAHILYKGLLMMSGGAVIFMTGKRKCTDIGGLYRTMPVTMVLCCVGAASISAFPLTGGFISKSMIIAASEHEHLAWVWHILMLASAGVFLHAGIKFPYFVFFAKDSGLRPDEPPLNMRLAMGLLAFLCLLIGIFPWVLYRILPYPVDFVPYTTGHVLGQLQILMYSALAFFVLLKFLKRTETRSLDTDWFYRMGARGVLWLVYNPFSKFGQWGSRTFLERLPSRLTVLSMNPLAIVKIMFDTAVFGFSGQRKKAQVGQRLRYEKSIYPGDIIKHWPIGSTVLWVTVFLLACLLIYYI